MSRPNSDQAPESASDGLGLESESGNEEFVDESNSGESDSNSNTGTNLGEPESSGANEQKEKEEIEDLIRRETQTVLLWRETVGGILMIMGFIAALAAYVFLGGQENQAFMAAFDEATLLISNQYLSMSRQLAEDAKVLADMVTMTAAAANSTFPFVTMPFFEVVARHIQDTDGSDLMLWAPVVTEEQRPQWEAYSTQNQNWQLLSAELTALEDLKEQHDDRRAAKVTPQPIVPYIHEPGLQGGIPSEVPQGSGPYAPVWQISPPLDNSTVINMDMFSFPEMDRIYTHLINTKGAAITSALNLTVLGVLLSEVYSYNDTENLQPHSMIVSPILNSLIDGPSALSTGFVVIGVKWQSFLEGVLPNDTKGVQVVVQNSCDEERPFTYLLNGPEAIYQGEGEDAIDSFYAGEIEYVVVSEAFVTEELGGCSYTLLINPTQQLRFDQASDGKVFFVLATLGLFSVIGLAFRLYDRSVQKRNEKMLRTAAKSNLIVSSLFPSTVKKRLMEDGRGDEGQGASWNPTQGGSSSKPLADFFPCATVLFADIVGFTAWSSVREPSQVFVLLETIYQAFDQIAKRRRIFKIETIGDCYVATAGLPEPRVDHATAMGRFAHECLNRVHELVARLEETLGPDTGDLSMRFGIHSGPVTAGVLRGERSRFQLFGDTVNTAARMESTGIRGRIQVSRETANLVAKAGKGSWLIPRLDKVVAKGKGEMTTFWLAIKSDARSSISGTETERSDECMLKNGFNHIPAQVNPKLLRLVNWNVEILSKILVQVVVRRRATKSFIMSRNLNEEYVDKKLRDGKMVIDEVEEIITLPKYHAGASKVDENHPEDLSEMIVIQLRQLVMTIAQSYKNNPFHNFEHASHVTMSVSKLLSRIVAPKIPAAANTSSREATQKLLHDHTYGITSDPLTQFACIFSALIHDAEHDGVSNAQLVQESTELALRYKNKSVAEQNSVDVAWSLLMQPQFKELRATIYCDEGEMAHFRRLVVNCVMATDIFDGNLKELRNKRWAQAFAVKEDVTTNREDQEQDPDVDVNRKATIVIEHLIQASDVSHTMQHWHIFRKWNEHLFIEMYFAYRQGRSANHPETFWYKGEIGFFDYYVIPLAKKLKECGVFGVSSDEYLNYAESNRNEWEQRGRDVVKELVAKAENSFEEVHGSKKEGESSGLPFTDQLLLPEVSVDASLVSARSSSGVVTITAGSNDVDV